MHFKMTVIAVRTKCSYIQVSRVHVRPLSKWAQYIAVAAAATYTVQYHRALSINHVCYCYCAIIMIILIIMRL